MLKAMPFCERQEGGLTLMLAEKQLSTGERHVFLSKDVASVRSKSDSCFQSNLFV